MRFDSLNTAMICIEKSLEQRGQSIISKDLVKVDTSKFGKPIYHGRILTNYGYYHVKYQNKEHTPLADNEVRTAHKENERLKYVIHNFGKGKSTDIGINENILFELTELESQSGKPTYILNAVGENSQDQQSEIYWIKALDFYYFTMRWGTVIYNSSAYGGSVYLVPTGLMKTWADPIVEVASLTKH